MQGSRMRNIKTEYVSCPSCGRTLFDLQEVGTRLGISNNLALIQPIHTWLPR